MKDLFPSYETCIKLHSLGFTQDVTFGYPFENPEEPIKRGTGKQGIAAPTFAEIWKQLPTVINEDCELRLVHDYGSEHDHIPLIPAIIYQDAHTAKWKIAFEDFNLAQIAAQLWIWCKENGHIK